MLTALEISSGSKLFARDASNSKSQFMCPSCRKNVILHQGTKRIHHFQHKANSVYCYRGEPEGDETRKMKMAIFDALAHADGVRHLEVEKHFGRVTADVFATIHGVPVSIEIQRKDIRVADMAWRAAQYRSLGVVVLWIALPNPQIRGDRIDRYEVKDWETWLHAAYFGRVYYWVRGQIVQAVHFDPCMVDSRSGEFLQVGVPPVVDGPALRRSRKYRTPLFGERVAITFDFNPVERQPFSAGNNTIPECALYVDGQPVWWKRDLHPQ